RLAKPATIAFQVANLAVIATFACIATLFVNNRFEFEYVWAHSDLRNPIAYRIAAIWSGQQGSFLLWTAWAAIFALFTVNKTKIYKRWYGISYAVVLCSLTAILAFESPFNLNMVDGKVFVPADGFGLAPSLQNYWVIIHPPTIFAGFASLTALFALAFAALMVKNYDLWLPIVRPLAIVALTLVGVGLCMGGFWAYETLGWGGFWMWDPVEIVSFVPWCFAIAFIHGIVVQTAKQKWKLSNLLLGGAPFLFFIYGTFLTRSGFLSDASVHSFAEMNSSALKLLIGLMAIVVLGFMGLWFVRVWQARKEESVGNERLTRDRWMSLGIWAVSLLGLASFVGMSVPLIMALRGQKPRVVEEGLYHQVLPYFFIPVMILMAIAPFLSWRKTDPKKLWGRVYSVACISIGITAALFFTAITTKYNTQIDLAPKVTMLNKYVVNGLSWIMFLVALCLFTVVASVWHSVERYRGKMIGTSGFMAHVGVALLMCGLIVSRGFERKDTGMLMKDHPTNVLGYNFTYSGMTSNDKDRENKLLLDVTGAGKNKIYTARPGMYKTTMGDGQETTMVWPDIRRGVLQDTYLALGQPQTNGTQVVTVKVGETVTFGELLLTHSGLKTEGQPGTPGTTFGASVKITTKGKSKVIEPKLELQSQGPPKELPASLDKNLNLVLTGMNASDKSVSLRVDFTDPMYPVEVFHKPFTSLVFLGTFLMTVAGIMSAWYRRAPQTSPVPAKAGSKSGANLSPDEGLTLAGESQ
ncbi:MAG: cytochrome c biogenesis protein CcsA, partial [Armatimonadetes bacterium]|nr:cytochrome c biogenesis protein CcsA [Armatimonadota bacterium]